MTPEEKRIVEHAMRQPLKYRVMGDENRPCLYGVAGPCFHPKCLEAHYETLRAAHNTDAQQKQKA